MYFVGDRVVRREKHKGQFAAGLRPSNLQGVMNSMHAIWKPALHIG